MAEPAPLPGVPPAPPSTTIFEGTEKTGKTAALVARAASLVRDGASPDDLLVFAASPDGAAVLRRRLIEADPRLATATVTTPRAWALDVLSDPRAQAFTGRRPRLLAPFEESFLLEDMKVSGVRPGRIGSLLKFFGRSWSDLADLDEHWLIFEEERELHQLAKDVLAAYGAYLATEVANAGYHYLSNDEAALAARQISHVLVDDYQNLSRASQHLAALAARKSLTVTCNPDTCIAVFEPYPYAAGADELAEACPGATVTKLTESALPPGVQSAIGHLNRLIRGQATFEDGLPKPGGLSAVSEAGLSIESCPTPADEGRRALAWIKETLGTGARPRDLAVVVPNKTWERNMVRALKAAGIPVRNGGQAGPVAGDVRYADLSEAAQFVTLVTLAADPRDGAALRAWCGFGDYLTHRALFSELLPLCGPRRDLAALLGELGTTPGQSLTFQSDAEGVSARVAELERGLKALRGLTGSALVQAAADCVAGRSGAPLPSAIAGLLGGLEETDDAVKLAGLLQRAMTCPRLPDEDAVAVVRTERAFGLEATHVVVTGLVNGFTPPRAVFDRTRTSPERAAALTTRAAGLLKAPLSLGARGALLLSFETLRAVDAEAQGLHIERFYADKGTRMARVSRSVLLR
ncbi:hypothetical protein [uncultured Adlercreutzia sp.]|uniref:hypothetical protein n=1 Tax=uncultured Adlercreutzia sp. TaxID=875803 RepID=UPI0025E363E9|nr:hypothetical protein [uncultured Adlercreutzia sp.]